MNLYDTLFSGAWVEQGGGGGGGSDGIVVPWQEISATAETPVPLPNANFDGLEDGDTVIMAKYPNSEILEGAAHIEDEVINISFMGKSDLFIVGRQNGQDLFFSQYTVSNIKFIVFKGSLS